MHTWKPFSILGRGLAGRALGSAWEAGTGGVRLLPSAARPEGFVLLAVPDGAIPALALEFPGRCAHLSGSLHLEGVPSVHPLTSFDGTPSRWEGTPLALTGAVPEDLVAAFEALGFLPFRLPAELKPLYHACAALASGHAASLCLGAAGLLAQAGVTLPGRGLAPLAEAALRHAEVHGTAGLTGPFRRRDTETIARDALALPGPWRDIFQRLGSRIQEQS